MPSPLCHVGLAWAVLAATSPTLPPDLRSAGRVGFVAIAADFDILVDLLRGSAMSFHHGPTHSFAFSAFLALVAGGKARATRVACWFAALAHPVLDWTTGDPGAPVRYGVSFFWPLTSQRYIAADPFFPPYHIDRAGGLLNMLAGEALPVYGREALVVAAAAGLALALRRWLARPGRSG